jgi:membrane protease YdiL (CAAX protease family)
MDGHPCLHRSRQRSHMVGLHTFAFSFCSRASVGALYIPVRDGMVAYRYCFTLSFAFEGTSGVRNLLGLLFRGSSKNSLWYLIGVLVPVAAVAFAIIMARHLHFGAAFIPLAALPLTLGLQVFTGAMGEELGWRGFLLSHLERRLSPRVAAVVMAITWALWICQLSIFPVCRNSTCLARHSSSWLLRSAFS